MNYLFSDKICSAINVQYNVYIVSENLGDVNSNFFLRWAFIPVVLYLKRRHKNAGIRAFTSVLQMCHGHVLNVFDHSLNIALWNFHNTCSKVRNNGAADMYLEARISNFI